MASLTIARLRKEGKLTTVGLNLSNVELTQDDCEKLGGAISQAVESFESALDSFHWVMGDFILLVERRFPEEASQLVESLDIAPASKSQYARVAERVPMARRREELSWSHHRSIVALEPALQDEWLAKASESNWTRNELESQMRGESEPRTRVVGDDVASAARAVYETADLIDDRYVVPVGPMVSLGEALGVVR